MQRRLFLAASGAASLALAGCGGGDDDNGSPSLAPLAQATDNRDIVQIAQATPSLSVLVEAVVAAGLVDTLKGAGPFTVFAPTDSAFTALLAELGTSKDALLANRSLLVQVLTYHVLAGRVLRSQVPVDTPIATVQGQTLRISPSLVITDQRGRTSNIGTTDIVASNGVVHLIDRVLLPRA